ncbi:hypothetical protein ABTN29_20630, partial [Acinetobacter baumannii]
KSRRKSSSFANLDGISALVLHHAIAFAYPAWTISFVISATSGTTSLEGRSLKTLFWQQKADVIVRIKFHYPVISPCADDRF